METDVPQKLKNAAIAQIASGLINWFVMSTMMCFFGSTICSLLTFFIGGLGGVCGWVALLLTPIGWVEIGVGVYGLMNPKEAAKFMKYVTYLEMGAVILGGIPAAIVGFLVSGWLADDEVVAYVES